MLLTTPSCPCLCAPLLVCALPSCLHLGRTRSAMGAPACLPSPRRCHLCCSPPTLTSVLPHTHTHVRTHARTHTPLSPVLPPTPPHLCHLCCPPPTHTSVACTTSSPPTHTSVACAAPPPHHLCRLCCLQEVSRVQLALERSQAEVSQLKQELTETLIRYQARAGQGGVGDLQVGGGQGGLIVGQGGGIWQ